MLHKKARPKRKESKSSTLYYCKGVGDLSRIYHDIVCSRFGRAVKTSIPVLSIFAFLGMISYAVAIISFEDVVSSDGEAYAAESTSTGISSSLIIDNGVASDSTATARTGVTYSSHTIQVKANNIDSYALTITGPTNMSNDGTTIGSVGTNVAGSNISDNKWGYGWGSTETANGSMAYNGFTGDTQTLDDHKTTAISNNKIDFTKKLVFAVKFADNAAMGHYRANVTLNLTLTPHLVATLANLTYLQDMTPDICANTPSTTEYTLKDIRDGNSYKVAKLSDGNCWMVDNMKLDLSTTTLNAANSDVSATYAAGTATNVTTASNWSSTNTVAQFIKSPSVNTSNPGDGKGYLSEYGYYYSWCAATAGTCSSTTSNNVDVGSSICPKGWQLPRSGSTASTNDFSKLINPTSPSTSSVSWSSNVFAGPPAYFTLGGANWLRAGYVNANGLSIPGSYAGYWSRTAYSSTYAYYLALDSSGYLYPAGTNSRYYGYLVRCVAYAGERNTFDNITTMQQMTPEVCSKAKTGDTATLLDTRDRKAYTIQKLNDGNCWMTRNLALDISTKSLATSDSDVSADFAAKSEYKADSTWTDNNATIEFTTNGKSASSGYDTAYGYYYSWCAATAGTCSSVTTKNTEASGSVCPKGWKLPKARANSWADNDFLQLMKTTTYNGWDGSTIVTASAFPTSDFTNKYVSASQLAVSGTPNSLYLGGVNWPRAGGVNSSGLYNASSNALYWSHTSYSSDGAYYLIFSGSYLDPAGSANRYSGFSVRCVAYSS